MKFITLLFVLLFSIQNLTTSANPNKQVLILFVMQQDDDTQLVNAIYTTFTTAEKIAKIQNVELISQNTVNDDVFVFTLKSETQQKLTLKMFDEEGFELAAHRVVEIKQGNNYKGLNVSSLNDGSYIFQLQDKNGYEITHHLNIVRD